MGVAGNLKQPTRQDVIDWAWASIEQVITVHSFEARMGGVDKAGNLKQPTRQDVIDWAWASIEQAITVHSFLVCGLANALDGTEDDKASDDIHEDEEDQENQDPSDSDVDSMGDPFSDETLKIKMWRTELTNYYVILIMAFLSCMHVSC